MLAFELFLKNKDSDVSDAKFVPIKKIIFQSGSWVVDKKDPKQYESDISPKFSSIQNWLSMPLLTSNPDLINLPDNRTSKRQPSPYIVVTGALKTKKKSSKDSTTESSLVLFIGDKSSKIEYSYNVQTQEIAKKESQVTLKLEKKNYKINNRYIFDLYVESGIIDSHGILNNSLYDKIIINFLDFVKSRKLENPPTKLPDFSVYLIPSPDRISFEKAETKKQDSESFTDAFGNNSDSYPSMTTKTAKFLSYDDKAFTLNCKQKSEFYENIGIGDKSLKDIFFPQNQVFGMTGLSEIKWMFTDISATHMDFVDTKKGIYSQIYENYKLLSDQKDKNKINYTPLLKIVCYKQNPPSQKLEILIDDNMTMERMDNLFKNMSREKIPFMAFEVLIEKPNNGKTVLWNNYLHAIKNFITQNNIPKDHLLNIFSRVLREKIYTWLNENKTEDIQMFFTRSYFCLETLCTGNMNKFIMNDNENFALTMGKIARNYIDFKENVKEKSNSLKDILTYSKYDREKLRFVLQRIGIGLNLSKANPEQISKINKEISDEMSIISEISDEEAHKDFSYFFYKGYYQHKEKHE